MSYAAKQKWSPKWFFPIHLKPYTLFKKFASVQGRKGNIIQNKAHLYKINSALFCIMFYFFKIFFYILTEREKEKERQ